MKPLATERLPDWISEELIVETIQVWQPHYDERLTDRQAIEILLSVGNLLDALGESDDGQAVPSTSEGF